MFLLDGRTEYKLIFTNTFQPTINIQANDHATYQAITPDDNNYNWYLLTIFHSGIAEIDEVFHSLDGYVVLKNNYSTAVSINPTNQWLGIHK